MRGREGRDNGKEVGGEENKKRIRGVGEEEMLLIYNWKAHISLYNPPTENA